VGRTLQASLAGQLEKLLASTGTALSEHVAKTARAGEQDALARREAVAALREKLQQELAGLRAALEQNIGRQGELISAQTSALTASTQQLEQLAASAGRQLDGLGEGVGKRLEQVADSVGVQLGQMSEWLSRKLEQLSGDVGQQLLQATSGAGEQLSQLGEGLGQQLTQLTGNISTQLAQVTGSIGAQLTQVTGNMDAQLAQLSGGVGEQLTRLTDGVGRELEARLSLSAELTERVQGAQALLTQSAGSFDQALTRQAQAVEALVGHGREQLAQLQETASQSTLAAVERVVQLAQGQAERLAQFESELQRVQQGHAQELSEQLGRHAAQLGSGLEGTGALVHEAADLLKATSVELSAVAESFAGSVERQRESAATWLETLGELEGAVERAGRGAAADALGDQLASTQEVFARQLQFQRELFEQLRSLRSPPHPSVHGERDVSA
jgi:DNA anti-recombination protein RmuC